MAIDPALFAKVAKVYEAAESVEGMKPKEVYESHQKCAPGEFGMHKDGPSGEAKKEKAANAYVDEIARRVPLEGVASDSALFGGLGGLAGAALGKPGKRLRSAARGASMGVGGSVGALLGRAAGAGLGDMLPGDAANKDLASKILGLAGGGLGLAGGLYGGYHAGGAAADAAGLKDDNTPQADEDEKAADSANTAAQKQADLVGALGGAGVYGGLGTLAGAPLGGLYGLVSGAYQGGKGKRIRGALRGLGRGVVGGGLIGAGAGAGFGGLTGAALPMSEIMKATKGMPFENAAAVAAQMGADAAEARGPIVHNLLRAAAVGGLGTGGYLGHKAFKGVAGDFHKKDNDKTDAEKAAADPRAMQINEGGPYTGPTPIANNYSSEVKNIGNNMQRGALGGAIAAPVVGAAVGRGLAGGAGAFAGQMAGGLLGQQLRHAGAQSAVYLGARNPNKPIPYGLMDGKLTNRPVADSVKGYFNSHSFLQGLRQTEQATNDVRNMVKTQSARAFGEKAAASVNWQNVMNTGLGGAALGAGLGGLTGLVAPGEDEHGRRRNRFGAMLRGALGGGLVGGGAGAAAEAASPGFGQSAANMARTYGGDLYNRLFGKQPQALTRGGTSMNEAMQALRPDAQGQYDVTGQQFQRYMEQFPEVGYVGDVAAAPRAPLV